MKKNNCDVFVSFEDIAEPLWLEKVKDFLLEILKERDHNNWELSVMFCSDAIMQGLNKQYRDKDSSTDVLSFEQGEEYIDDDGNTRYIAGDIAICVNFLYKNAEDFDVLPDEELKRLLIHGILHLEGYDHENALGEETNEMFNLQESLLKTFQEYNIIG